MGKLEDLIAWQKAMDLTEVVYTSTSTLPREEEFGLKSQMRRAAVSVPSNIAEGWGRGGGSLFVHLDVAYGSLLELKTQILLCLRLGYLKQLQTNALLEACEESSRLVVGLKRGMKK